MDIDTKKENSIKKQIHSIQNKTKIIPLGGVEEIGINCTLYEYNQDILMVDLGLGFSDFDYYGIDAVIPDVNYAIKRKKNLKGIVITHGHLDHIGAIAYHIANLDFPNIYGTKFTIELLKAKIEEKGLLEKLRNKFHFIDPSSKLKLGPFDLSFFHVNHSIPQSVGVFIKTPTAKIIQTGDFKFDNSPLNEPVTDYAQIAEYGKEGIDLLLSDSTNSMKKGHPASESDVAKSLEDIVERSKGRVIIASFGGLVGRLAQLLEIAKNHNKKVAIAGYSMNQAFTIAVNVGFIKISDNLILPIDKIKNLPPNKVMILTTGAQGETNAGLSMMATQGYKGFFLKKGDTVVLSARTIVGNDKAVQNMIDKITSKGATIQQSEHVDFFTSGHGYQEDQKIMMNLVKPKFFMPVHGYQYFLRAHGETAKSVGIPEKNIIIAKRGSIVEGDSKTGFKISKEFECEPLVVSGSVVGDVGATVLKEREQLASFGMVIVNMLLNEDKSLKRDPHVVTKGFVYAKESQELIKEISNLAKKIYIDSDKKDFALVREEINDKISDFLFKATQREPIVLSIINY